MSKINRVHCSGRFKRIFLEFNGMPCKTDPDDPKGFKYIYPDFGADLIDTIFFNELLPVSKPAFLPWRRQKCCQCGMKLPVMAETNRTFNLDLALPRTDEFQLSVNSPFVICPECQAEQIYSNKEVSDEICQAILNAFKAIQLTP